MTMENIHGIDVSWMHHKDHSRTKTAHKEVDDGNTVSDTPAAQTNGDIHENDDPTSQKPTPTNSTPKPIPIRPGVSRTASNERNGNGGQKGASPSPSITRRNSWLSSISSKFSSSPSSQHAGNGTSTSPGINSPTAHDLKAQRSPVGTPNAVAVQSNVKAEAEAPYTPTPPKSGQHNFLQSALRRLSSSGGQLSSGGKGGQQGICQRRTLNIDPHRERCRISELDQAKLRRVAFCVDVEIAGGPRYTDDDGTEKKDGKVKKKEKEKGEGAALKHPDAVKREKEEDGVIKASGETVPREPPTEQLADAAVPQIPMPKKLEESATDAKPDSEAPEKDITKKKEKKKRSEEERKARKEKKRKQAEANGTLPVELVRDDSDSSVEGSPKGTSTPKTQAAPTIDPVRIYRRCCQLRETPILKKITEQLAAPSNVRIGMPGVVGKLDLSSYWLSLPDLVTLGDYLAVVPVKELIMENCGLTDEGVRVILAGLLAARLPETMSKRRRRKNHEKDGEVHFQGGVVERVVLKNNKKIGRDGWRHVCLFMHMARSLKFLDLSMIPFPQAVASTNVPGNLRKTMSNLSAQADPATIMSRAIAERLAGPEFELLNLAETGINSEQLGKIIDGISKSGLRRLGLAGNNIDAEGMSHIARYLKEGKCEGLDLGGNHSVDLEMIAASLNDEHPLWALSLADCSLTPDALWKLFPALSSLKNFRFIDVSHNHELFNASPSAVSLFRRYLPKLKTLKRIHLTDTSLSPEQAIALAEILPENPSLAHINIMENPQLAELADAKGEASQEEACALYASLMAAVRVSSTIVCIDIEVPNPASSEVVKALAKQVVAYCLRNMERAPIIEIGDVVVPNEHYGEETEVAVPEVLMHLVGHGEGSVGSHDDDDLAPDEDYVIGGTGVVKALGICLNRGHDSRTPSIDRRYSNWSERAQDSPRIEPVSGGKAKDMSKNLLGSARKIRARLQPALLKESRLGDRHNYNRLLFLDQTLERMIQRFEEEYPETRLPDSIPSALSLDPENASPSETSILSTVLIQPDESAVFANSDDESPGLRPALSRHNSDVSLASKALSQEEGRMHRFGQQFRRDILRPQTPDHLHNTTGNEQDPKHLEMLRAMIDELGGEEIKRKVEEDGQDAVIAELGNEASVLKQQLMESDPEGWAKFKEAQEVAQRNNSVIGLAQTPLSASHSAVED